MRSSPTIQQQREPTKDKRRNEARELTVNGVRAQRANHEGDQYRRSGSSPPGNQHTKTTEDFQDSDDILGICGVAHSLDRINGDLGSDSLAVRSFAASDFPGVFHEPDRGKLRPILSRQRSQQRADRGHDPAENAPDGGE
jgi:hypothetical protein